LFVSRAKQALHREEKDNAHFVSVDLQLMQEWCWKDYQKYCFIEWRQGPRLDTNNGNVGRMCVVTRYVVGNCEIIIIGTMYQVSFLVWDSSRGTTRHFGKDKNVSDHSHGSSARHWKPEKLVLIMRPYEIVFAMNRTCAKWGRVKLQESWTLWRTHVKNAICDSVSKTIKHKRKMKQKRTTLFYEVPTKCNEHY